MNKNKIIKYVISAIAVISFIGIIAYLFPVIKDISTPIGQELFKEKVQKMGIWGFLLLFALDVAQIFLIILPGEPLEVLAGMCYGAVGGSIFIFTVVLSTTTIIVYLVKKYGKKFLYHFISKEKIEKVENSKIFKNKRKLETLVMILFLIPGTPKDMLVYIGGLLPMNPIKFILISTFVRFPSVISSTIAGAGISRGDFKLTILVYALTFILSFILIIIINLFDKEKITKEAITTIK